MAFVLARWRSPGPINNCWQRRISTESLPNVPDGSPLEIRETNVMTRMENLIVEWCNENSHTPSAVNAELR